MRFESLDADTMDRTMQPIYLTSLSITNPPIINRLNAHMDHIWDGVYTGQKRLSRFTTQIMNDQEYEIRFTGTPAKNMRYKLNAAAAGTGTMIRLKYPETGLYEVYINNVLKDR